MACGEDQPEPRRREEHICDHKKPDGPFCYGEYGLGTCTKERCLYDHGCKKLAELRTTPAPEQP